MKRHRLTEHVIADKAYDTDKIRAYLSFRTDAVIPSLSTRREPPPYDEHLYKERHLVECFINKIKHFRRVATRYDKTAVAFLAFVAVRVIHGLVALNVHRT
jgi:transposase